MAPSTGRASQAPTGPPRYQGNRMSSSQRKRVPASMGSSTKRPEPANRRCSLPGRGPPSPASSAAWPLPHGGRAVGDGHDPRRIPPRHFYHVTRTEWSNPLVRHASGCRGLRSGRIGTRSNWRRPSTRRGMRGSRYPPTPQPELLGVRHSPRSWPRSKRRCGPFRLDRYHQSAHGDQARSHLACPGDLDHGDRRRRRSRRGDLVAVRDDRRRVAGASVAFTNGDGARNRWHHDHGDR